MKTIYCFLYFCIITLLFQLISINCNKFAIYNIRNGFGIVNSNNGNETSLISRYKTNEIVTCLIECNKNNDCLTSEYNKFEKNCYLYNRYFNKNNDSSLNSMVSLYEKNCSLVNTFDDIACIKQNQSLVKAFQTYKLRFSLKGSNDYSFTQLHSSYCVRYDNETKYYALDYNGKMLIFDENWEFKGLKNFSKPAFMIQIGVEDLFISSGSGVYKVDKDLMILKYYNIGSSRGIVYDEENNTVLVTNPSNKRIVVFDRNLNLIEFISTGIYQPFSIGISNGKIYTGTINGYLLVIYNKLIISSIQVTFCLDYLHNILFDSYSTLAFACSKNNMSYAYFTVNLTYTGVSIQTSYRPTNIKFDEKGRLVMTTFNSLDIYY